MEAYPTDSPLPSPAPAAPTSPYRAPPEAPVDARPAHAPGVVLLLVVAAFALLASIASLDLTRRALRLRPFDASHGHRVAPAWRPESRLDTAAQELARRARRPLFIAPDVDGRAALRVIAPGSLDAPLPDVVRALDAYAAARGLWFHEADGVLRLERAVTAVDLACDGPLDACATRLERVASVQVVRTPEAGRRPVRLRVTRDAPAVEGARASLATAGLEVDVVGRTLYVSAAPGDASEFVAPTPAPFDIRRRAEGTFLVSRRFLDRVLEDQAALMRTTRIMPVTRGGRVLGVQLFGVRPDDLTARLGLRNGDVLLRVNGLDIASPERCLEAYARLRQTDRLTVTLERAGRELALTYVIV